MNDRLTTLLQEEAPRLFVRLADPGQLRRAAQHKRAVRRTAAAVLAVAAVVIVALFAGPNPLVGAHRAVPANPPARHPTQFAGLPAVGTPVSTPADGRVLLNISPESGAEWNIYADGRIIWQRWSSTGDPLVIPTGADPFQTTYVQQRLTPHGVQLLLSQILATGQATGLFRSSLALGDEAFEGNQQVAWYQACNNGHLIYTQVLPPSTQNDPITMVTPAQMRALGQINRLAADPSSMLPDSAWADRTIRPYIPSHYQLGWDRSAPDPSKLPSPARDVLQPLLQPMPGRASRTITTDQARALLAALAQSGVKLVGGNHAGGLSFELPAVSIPSTVLEVGPALPSSPLSDSDQC